MASGNVTRVRRNPERRVAVVGACCGARSTLLVKSAASLSEYGRRLGTGREERGRITGAIFMKNV
jgi:dienelactone hydrolase